MTIKTIITDELGNGMEADATTIERMFHEGLIEQDLKGYWHPLDGMQLHDIQERLNYLINGAI